jgi:hypothetical protein
MQFVSRILGLSPFHIDTNYTFRNKGGYTYSHIIQATVMIFLLLGGLCNNVLTLVVYNDRHFNVFVRIVWIINVLVSHLASVLALLFSVTRNRNLMTSTMSLLTCIDNKLFRNKSKQDAYAKQRSNLKIQLWIFLVIYGIGIFYIYSYSEGTWTLYMSMASQILSGIINNTMIIQYVNIVLMMKEMYHPVEHILSEAAITDDGNSSTSTDTEHSRSCRIVSSNKTFSIRTFNWTSGTNSSNHFKIRDLRVICSELYDVMHTNNKSFEMLILLDVITILTNTVPTTYCGFINLKLTIVENGPFQLYLLSLSNILLWAFLLLNLLCLTMCCQKQQKKFAIYLLAFRDYCYMLMHLAGARHR